MALELRDLNAATAGEFVELADFLVENSSWVLNRIAGLRPFPSKVEMCDAIETEIKLAARDDQVRLFKAHPELAGVEAQAGNMTEASTGEQARLGLTSLNAGDHARLQGLNAQYRGRFGFPFIIALHRQPTLAAVFASFERRLANAIDQEIAETISEIMLVVQGRAERIVGDRASTSVDL